jgi:hypothetical protein
MEGAFSAVISKEMVYLAAAAIAAMLFIGMIPINGKRLRETKFWQSWGSFVLVAVCFAGSFAPGIHDIPLKNWGAVLAFALCSSMVAHLGRAILKPLVLTKLEGKK